MIISSRTGHQSTGYSTIHPLLLPLALPFYISLPPFSFYTSDTAFETDTPLFIEFVDLKLSNAFLLSIIFTART
jgi:hypothetical protein